MDLTITKRMTVKVDTLLIDAAVRYDEEDMPRDFPGRTGDVWRVRLDLATGRISLADGKPWPGPAIDLCMKVCDEGIYSLMSAGTVVAKHDGYVPGGFGIGRGDYLEFKTDERGQIVDWDGPDLSAFDDE